MIDREPDHDLIEKKDRSKIKPTLEEIAEGDGEKPPLAGGGDYFEGWHFEGGSEFS